MKVLKIGHAAPALAGITQADVDDCKVYQENRTELDAEVQEWHVSRRLKLVRGRGEVSINGNILRGSADLEPLRKICFGMKSDPTQITAVKCAVAMFLYDQGLSFGEGGEEGECKAPPLSVQIARIILPRYVASKDDAKKVYFRVSADNFGLIPADLAKPMWQLGRIPEVATILEQAEIDDYLGVMKNSASRAAATCRRLAAPPEFISNDPHVPCLCYYDLEGVISSAEESPGTDAWDEFLARVDEPEIFLAWIYSIFLGGDMGRQALWLLGEGSDGKSIVTKAIANQIPNSWKSLSYVESTNQFASSKAEGKRLILVPDLKSKTFIATPLIHQLTGGDSLDIERKGQDGYNATCHSKVLICSNEEPRITSDENQISRLILLRVRPRLVRGEDTDWQGRLEKEFPALLAKAKPCYETHVVRGRIISVKDLTQEIASTEEILANALLQHHVAEGVAIIPEAAIHLNLSSTANFDRASPIYEKVISFKHSKVLSDDQKKSMRMVLSGPSSTEKSLLNICAFRNVYERKLRYQGWIKQGTMWINRAMFLEQSAKNPKLMDDLLTEHPGLFPFFGMEGIL